MKDAIETIIATLAPVIGEHMARAVVTGSCDKMGIPRESATATDIEKLVHSLGLGLNVFVGRVKSKVLTDQLHKKLGLAHKP
jgi:hypothetical protein